MALIAITLALALPWLAATAWVAHRAGRRILWSNPDGTAFESQAAQLTSFGAR